MGQPHPQEMALREAIVRCFEDGMKGHEILAEINSLFTPSITEGGLNKRILVLRKDGKIGRKIQALTDQHKADIRKLYEHDIDIPSIARMLSIPEPTVHWYVQHSGLANRRRIITDEEKQTVIELALAGKFNEEIKQITGIKKETIKAIRREYAERTGVRIDQRKSTPLRFKQT